MISPQTHTVHANATKKKFPFTLKPCLLYVWVPSCSTDEREVNFKLLVYFGDIHVSETLEN